MRIDHARRLLAFNEGPFPVAQRVESEESPGATTPTWPLLLDPRMHYHLRGILPSETVLDIGDNVDEATAARHANAISLTLRSWGVPHWTLLSGGSGIHIHAFFHDEPPGDATCDGCGRSGEEHVYYENERTWAIWSVEMPGWICRDWQRPKPPTGQRRSLVRQVLEATFWRTGDASLEVDPRKVAPGPRSLIREVGARKRADSTRTKSLWCAWPTEEWRDVPENLDEAYAQCDARLPPAPEAFDASAFDFSTRDDFGGHACPKRASCIDAWGLCNDCPVTA